METQVGNPNAIYLIGFAVLALVLFLTSELTRSRARDKFGSKNKTGFFSIARVKRMTSALLIAASLVLLSIAMMDIRWGKMNQKVPQKGLEVVFALDVSRSMLATDASPNRLQRAKDQIKDMVGEMTGDRIGLVVFAGEADQVVPLTNHYSDFKQMLDSVGPHSLTVGGSKLGEAIQTASEGFMAKTNDHKTIVLITDGEDQESDPVGMAKKLHAENGTRIFTIGLGDMDKGSRIPDSGDQRANYVQHEGQQVWSKLNGKVLKSIATETNGAYIPAGTKHVNMADVYHRYIANVEKTEFEEATINTYVPRFQLFAIPALILLLLEGFVSGKYFSNKRKSNQKENQTNQSQMSKLAEQIEMDSMAGSSKTKKKVLASMLLFVIFVGSSSEAFSQEGLSTAKRINNATKLLGEDKVIEAIEAYNEIERESQDYQDELDYNLAIAHYRNNDYPAANVLFEQTAKSVNDTIAADSRYNLGNCQYLQALEKKEDPVAAIDQLKSAVKHYRSSLQVNADNADARANIELAMKLIDELEQKQKEQDQQQQDQQDQQQQQEEQQQDQEQQNQDQNQQSQSQDQEQQNQEEQEQNDSQQNQQDSESQDSQDQSQQGKDQSQQDKESSEENQEEKESSESKEEQESEQKEQEQSEQSKSSQQNQESQQEKQPHSQTDQQEDGHAEKQDETAAEEQDKQKDQAPPQGELKSLNEQEQDASKEGQPFAIEEDSKLMTQEEALKLLQSVRDRDMKRRYQQEMRNRSQRVRVDRDW